MSKDNSVNTDKLPESQAFTNKDPNQYKRNSDTGKPVDKNEKPNENLEGKTFDRTSKEEGLNQAKSTGSGGAFEGLENLEEG